MKPRKEKEEMALGKNKQLVDHSRIFLAYKGDGFKKIAEESIIFVVKLDLF